MAVDARGNCNECGGTHYGSFVCPYNPAEVERLDEKRKDLATRRNSNVDKPIVCDVCRAEKTKHYGPCPHWRMVKEAAHLKAKNEKLRTELRRLQKKYGDEDRADALGGD